MGFPSECRCQDGTYPFSNVDAKGTIHFCQAVSKNLVWKRLAQSLQALSAVPSALGRGEIYHSYQSLLKSIYRLSETGAVTLGVGKPADLSCCQFQPCLCVGE